MEKHNFPAKLYFKDSKDTNYFLPKFTEPYLFYGDRESLKPNQEAYGFGSSCGGWNLIVTYKDSKYITSHYMKHLDNRELVEEIK